MPEQNKRNPGCMRCSHFGKEFLPDNMVKFICQAEIINHGYIWLHGEKYKYANPMKKTNTGNVQTSRKGSDKQ